MSKLLIVESPAKAKTITKYLGAGYSVKASMGHLRDLPRKNLGVDPDNNFAAEYIPIEGKDKVISELRTAADKADGVFLATDPDREGEAISWHLQQLLGLDAVKARRITFNEITKKAVTEAVENPRDIDMDLVDAQQARRILDRIVGYKLSPFLWRKVRTGLSAGRVQSVVTRMVVEREREIQAFIPVEYWSITVTLEQDAKAFTAALWGDSAGKLELKTEAETNAVLSAIEGGAYTVQTVKKAKKRRQPAPPFITSTLQQEASRKLGMASRRAMSVAQELYEGIELGEAGLTGLITYMRTDSLRLSDEALSGARDYIGGKYGKDYLPATARTFKTKKGAQDAHEAIRPAEPSLEPDAIKKFLTPDQYRLYKLIWSRFVACQMADAIFDTVSADIGCAGYIFRATGQTVSFPGFLALYEESVDEDKDEDAEGVLPPLREGDRPAHKETMPRQHFTQPPPRYTEASLIKAMEERGIGRPSTYAPTISVVLDREYIVKEGKALRPTNLGVAVNDLIVDKFTDVVDIGFTAQMEERLDAVERGETDYHDILHSFYSGFDAQLKQAEIDLDKQRIKVPDEVTDIICDQCGQNMVIKVGRFGKFLGCPGYPECTNTKPMAQDTGVPCPKCGSKLLKRKSKSGYYYYGCERHPECDFMTWDSPQPKRQCPQCGGTVYKHYTKEDKRWLCHVPDCGWSEQMATRKKKADAEGTDGEAKPRRAAAKKGETAAKTAKKPAAKKPTSKAAAKTETKTAAKKPAAKKAPAKKPAAKKPAAKKTADAE